MIATAIGLAVAAGLMAAIAHAATLRQARDIAQRKGPIAELAVV